MNNPRLRIDRAFARSTERRLLVACALVSLLAGCWRSSPPEIQEFVAPVRVAAVEAPTSQPAESSATAVEAPKPEAEPEAPPPVNATATAAAPVPAPTPEPVKAAPKGPTIVGTWRMTGMARGDQVQELPASMVLTFTFGEDGTLSMSQSAGEHSASQSGTYTLSGDQISMTMQGRTQSGTVTFNGDSEMTIDISEGKATFVRS